MNKEYEITPTLGSRGGCYDFYVPNTMVRTLILNFVEKRGMIRFDWTTYGQHKFYLRINQAKKNKIQNYLNTTLHRCVEFNDNIDTSREKVTWLYENLDGKYSLIFKPKDEFIYCDNATAVGAIIHDNEHFMAYKMMFSEYED